MSVSDSASCTHSHTHAQVQPGKGSKPPTSHALSLQALANGVPVPYQDTLRVVSHEGGRALRAGSATTRKPPGYIRNESGGMFAS